MHSFFVAPSNFDVIVVTGPDSVRFLQGQLTCDVAAIEEAGFSQGAVCNNKGRVVAAFTLIRWRDSFYLCMTAGLGAIFLATLKKYLPFYKCSLQISSENLYAISGEGIRKVMLEAGVGGDPPASGVIGVPGGWLCLLDSGFSRAFLLTEQTPARVQSLVQPCSEGTLEEWEAISMLAGHYPFRATDTEQFTPQELHFDRNGYVSFSKGCYTGQEIVARMHYRGKQKKQLYLVIVNASRVSAHDDLPLVICDASGVEWGRSLVTRTLRQETLALVQLPVDLGRELFTQDGQAVKPMVFTTG